MNKPFYNHIINTNTLVLELQKLTLEPNEMEHLVSLAEASLHKAVLNTILSELAEEDKELFLNHLSIENHIKLWELLNLKIPRIEEKIRNEGTELLNDFIDDIRNIR